LDLSKVKHVGRLKDIVFVLLKYGFDDVVERLEVPGKLLLKRVIRVDEELTTSQRIRHTLEELGPTFIKFGQVMSLRTDILPAELVLELRKLHDRVPPVSFTEIRGKVEQELGDSIESVFIQFDEEAVAGASLAQVHRGVLREGRQAVAVKVQRPGIRHSIDSDLALMKTLAKQLDRRMEAAAVYDLPHLVDEFKKTLLRELSYVREARHMRIFRGNFSGDPGVHVPELYEQHSTDKLLVMELIDGVKMSELTASDSTHRPDLARRGLRITVKQILEDGFFHADPHPGNIFVRDDDVLCMIDCGMVGRLTLEMRFKLTEMLQATVDKDGMRLLEVLLDVTHGYDRVDRYALHRDLLDLLDGYHSVPLEELNLGGFLAEITDILREHRLKLPQDLAIMIKALVTAEGVARELDPELDVVAEVQPLVDQLVYEQWKPHQIWRSIRSNLRQIAALQKQLPRRLGQISEKLERGELAVKFQHENLEDLENTLEDIASRLTVAIIVAAIVVGSSLIVTADVGPTMFGYPALGIIGYLFSAVLGLWIVFNILRSHW